MSTVAEIESAIEELPSGELPRLLNRLLAKLWPARFHLPPSEVEALAADLADFRADPLFAAARPYRLRP
jgi:hypothetical protein